MSRIALVVAKAANGVIGSAGRIPWHLPEDMRRFKQQTMGKPCIMGRKTWESLPKKPLPGRTNIIITRDARYLAEGAVVVHAFDDAVVQAQEESSEEVAIIGGEAIYRAALPRADVIYLTDVLADFPGDAYFPAIAPENWREAAREELMTVEGLRYRFLTLERVRKSAE